MKLILTVVLALVSQWCLALEAGSLESHTFSSTITVDGVVVDVFPKSREDMERAGQSVAYTIYRGERAAIYYDAQLFSELGPLAKFLIMEHERAHHYLGHTLITKLRFEQNSQIPAAETQRKEKDADCQSGYTAKDLGFNLSRGDIHEALRQTYQALTGVVGRPPSWVLSRVDTIDLCFQGHLLSRPKVMPIPEELH